MATVKSEEYLAGVVVVGDTRYSLPIGSIHSIESSSSVSKIDDSWNIHFNGTDIPVYDLGFESGKGIRELCVVTENIAIFADEFKASSLSLSFLKKLPSIMINTAVSQYFFDKEDNGLIFDLDIEGLQALYQESLL